MYFLVFEPGETKLSKANSARQDIDCRLRLRRFYLSLFSRDRVDRPERLVKGQGATLTRGHCLHGSMFKKNIQRGGSPPKKLAGDDLLNAHPSPQEEPAQERKDDEELDDAEPRCFVRFHILLTPWCQYRQQNKRVSSDLGSWSPEWKDAIAERAQRAGDTEPVTQD